MTADTTPRHRTSARGLSMVLAGSGAQAVLRLLLAALTARLVSPEQTGAFQFALSVVMLATAAADPGLSEAMVRGRARSRTIASTVFWVNVGLGGALGGILVLVSGPLTAGFGLAQSRDLVAALAIVPILVGLSLGPFVVLRQQLRFAEIAVIETGASLVGCLACAIVAFKGGGAWALAAYQFGWFATRVIAAFARAPVRPGLVFRWRGLARVGWFSAQVWAARLAAVLSTQMDKIVLGSLLGAHALGLYALGMLFVSVPITMITSATSTALVPAFAHMGSQPSRLRSEFLETSRLIGLLTFPAYFGAAALAAPLVAVVLGQGAAWDWKPVGPILAILAPVGALECLMRPQRAFLLARGRSGLALAVTLASAGALLAGVGVGATAGGIRGAALGAMASTCAVFPIATVVALRHAGASLREYLSAIGPTIAAASAMAAVLVLAQATLSWSGASELAQLAFLTPLGAAVYVACLTRLDRNAVRDLQALWARWKPAPQASRP